MEGENNLLCSLEEADGHVSDEEEPPDVEISLSSFRQQWQDELEQAKWVKLKKVEGQNIDPKVEDEAKILFLKGMTAEQTGEFYEAIQFYRRSMQLIPDIEQRIDYLSMRQPRGRQESESSAGSVELDDLEDDLVTHFQKMKINDNYAICYQEYEQRGMHISSLPNEVINYIFKWVISNDLDLKSLENISQVCRGFYLLARDEELWRLICQRIWGINCGKCKKYGGWREMYLQRPHLQYNGCYICRCSYLREGEQTFDGLYRPWHIIHYYRYARFFPDGIMLMSTSPDDPIAALAKLRSRHSKESGMLQGFFRMSGNRVLGVLKRVKIKESMLGYQKFIRSRNQGRHRPPESDQLFQVEFEITNSGKRKHNKLVWMKYSIKTIYKQTGEENVADFDLSEQNYPPLVFSRVRSYCAIMSSPLTPWTSKQQSLTE